MNKLKEKRLEAGMSQWDLATASNVSYRMIQFYEQGVKDINKAQVVTVTRLAEALNCNVNDLIDKPVLEKEYLAIGKWQDEYTGAGIYSLVDQDGKRYIGQALNVQRRLEQHRIALNKALKGNRTNAGDNMELIDAVISGKRFHVEILKKLEWNDTTKNKLNFWERHYLRKFGGFAETYNSNSIDKPRWNYSPYNEISIYLDLDESKDADIIAYLDTLESVQGEVKRMIREDMKKR